ncbi:MAG: S1-like domain-containing RNA-binding protein, partial [Chthoniobacterales bacterium]
GDMLDVFVYRDSEDRLVATTETPYAMVGDFAFLRIVEVKPNIGAFLDWGLEKDLLLPRRELGGFRNEGDWVVVHISIDEKSDRIVASAHLNAGFSRTPPPYEKEQPVKLLIYGETPLGYNAIVDNTYRGLVFRSDLASPLIIGQYINGFVRSVRSDGKLDLALDRSGFGRIAPLTEKIIETLKVKGGRLPYSDNSTPEEIRMAFGVSKKAFKQAIGTLYRNRRISIEEDAIQISTDEKPA